MLEISFNMKNLFSIILVSASILFSSCNKDKSERKLALEDYQQNYLGSIVDDVERLIAKEAGTKHAIGVGSGTDAIFLSLKALGIGPGDEVILPSYTFSSTATAVSPSGAETAAQTTLSLDLTSNFD